MNNTLRRRLLSIFLIMAVFTTIFSPITAKADTEEEIDEEESIVYVSSQSDLSSMTASKTYILTEDIDITGNWNSIDNFIGIFDGGGHTITYTTDTSTGAFVTTQYLGLFGTCSGATIKNVYVNGNITLTTNGSIANPNMYIGGIVAKATNTTLENVHFSGNISVTTNNDNSSWVGGLVGQATSTQISLSSNTASVTTTINSYIGITKTGGLVGELNGSVENCYNIGNVSATSASDSPYAGGLTGVNSGSIGKSYNAGTVNAQSGSMGMGDVYAGGIAALSETGSTITDCAVLSSSISVSYGWVNSGYKYIIAKGGTKSNNIATNTISGSPSNDANSRYTNAQLKTTAPYSFDFYNTWAINENINNGYPYHYRNAYAVSSQNLTVPSTLQSLIDDGLISINDIKQTDDGFTLCTKPLSEIFTDMGVPSQINGSDGSSLSLFYLTSWYIYSVGNNYSILKMRGYEEAKRIAEIEAEEAGEAVGEIKGVGTSIPFMDFDMSLINLFYEDFIQQVNPSQNEFDLYTALRKLIYGNVDANYTYCVPIANYFASASSKGNHLIAEEYIKKVLTTERDANGYINVPSNVTPEQIEVLEKLPDGYDSIYNRIKVGNYNLTNKEKNAILACRTGNLSLNAYAAENIAHAVATIKLGDFLQTNDTILVITLAALGEAGALVTYEFTRAGAAYLFPKAIKSDAGVGEESIPKEQFVSYLLDDTLVANFGDV